MKKLITSIFILALLIPIFGVPTGRGFFLMDSTKVLSIVPDNVNGTMTITLKSGKSKTFSGFLWSKLSTFEASVTSSFISIN